MTFVAAPLQFQAVIVEDKEYVSIDDLIEWLMQSKNQSDQAFGEIFELMIKTWKETKPI